MLFANVFFETKPVVQVVDPDTQIWEEAKIEGFEGTNHVRVNFTRWGKNKNPVRVLFCDPKFLLKIGQSGTLLKKFYFPDDTILITNWITLKKKFEKGDIVYFVTAPSVGVLMEPWEMKQMIQQASVLKSGTVLINDRFRKTLLICFNVEIYFVQPVEEL